MLATLLAWSEPLAKAVTYGALLLVIGVSGARWTTIRAWPRHERLDDVHERLDRVALAGAATLLLALLARAWAHTVTAFGAAESFVWGNVRLVAVDSRWGSAWRTQVASALVVLVFALAADLWRRRRWRGLVTLAACGTAFALTGSGHAASSAWLRAVHALHLVAAGAWVGTLSTLLVAARHRPSDERLRAFHHVAPLAGVAVSAMLATGLVMAVRYLGGVDAMASSYAAWLAVKTTLVLAMLGLGAWNWSRLRGRATARWLRTIDVEVLAALLVVLATAILTETAHP